MKLAAIILIAFAAGAATDRLINAHVEPIQPQPASVTAQSMTGCCGH